jgi:hypothetical protein
MLMQLFLYVVVSAFSYGLITLAPLVEIRLPVGRMNGEEVLLTILFLVTFHSYMLQRKRLRPFGFGRIEVVWLIFVALFLIVGWNSPASSIKERFLNVRIVERYLLFFPTVAVCTSLNRIKIIVKWGIFFAITGTILTIAQSIYGLTNLFGSDYYNIGVWGGNKMYLGSLARVNLPISNWIAFVILVIFAQLLLRWKWNQVFLATFLCITVLLNFARSLWLGMLGACFVIVWLLYREKVVSRDQMVRLSFFPLIIGGSLLVGSLVGLSDLPGALMGRILEGIFIFETGSGTWSVRLVGLANAITLWLNNWAFGVGLNYWETFGGYLDLGIAIVLLSVGIVGFFVLCWLLYNCWGLAISTLKRGIEIESHDMIIAGVSMAALIILMLVYQQWINPYVTSILGFISGIAVSLRGIASSEMKTS